MCVFVVWECFTDVCVCALTVVLVIEGTMRSVGST